MNRFRFNSVRPLPPLPIGPGWREQLLQQQQAEGDAPPPAPAAPPPDFTAQINSAVANAIAAALPQILSAARPPAPPPPPAPAPAPPAPGIPPPPPPTTISPEENARIQAMSNQIADLTKKAEENERRAKEADLAAIKAQTESQINAQLAQYKFRNPDSQRVAFDYINKNIHRDPQTGVLTGDNLPLANFVDKSMEMLVGLLAPLPGSGAGMVPGSLRPTGFDIDLIRPGITPENSEIARHEVRRVLSAAGYQIQGSI